VERAMAEIVRPTIAGMKARGTPFVGVLYAGLMISHDGSPRLIEYNVRFGDPETQVLMVRLKSDLLAALIATADGVLANFDLRWHADAALTVVMAARGYPGSYARGSVIRGLSGAAEVPGVEIFHAGTRAVGDQVFADGGRVLAVTARAPTIAEAQALSYRAVDLIDWPEGFCRRDIGWRAIGKPLS
ncbi:MAG: phosphoribosylamine--glycine ligase, partial [Hyphomicrobiaceae bacterium]